MSPSPLPAIGKALLWVTLPLYLLDQATKFWIILHFHPPFARFNGSIVPIREDSKAIISGFFWLVRRHNQGVAFGFANGTTWAPIAFLLLLVIALFAVFFFWKKEFFEGIARFAPPLLIAGIAGNLTDRLLQGFFLKDFSSEPFFSRLLQGYVVDFLDFKLPFYPASNGHWPAFNIADSCICLAAFFLFVSAFSHPKKQKGH